MGALNTGNRIAIRVGGGEQAVVLVQSPQHGRTYSIKGKDEKALTQGWLQSNHADFFQIVHKILADDRDVSRE